MAPPYQFSSQPYISHPFDFQNKLWTWELIYEVHSIISLNQFLILCKNESELKLTNHTNPKVQKFNKLEKQSYIHTNSHPDHLDLTH